MKEPEAFDGVDIDLGIDFSFFDGTGKDKEEKPEHPKPRARGLKTHGRQFYRRFTSERALEFRNGGQRLN
jgi:hypothetical protein